MRKQIEVIDTEWDKRRERKERETPSQRKTRVARQKAQGAKHRFVNKTAKKLQKTTPKSETWFLSLLKENGLGSFFLQNIQLNNVIPDFLNLQHRIVIEVDGSAHWNEKQQAKDKRKDELYAAMNYTCYRVAHNDFARATEVISIIQDLRKGDSNNP